MLAGKVLEHLRAELGAQQIEVCVNGTSERTAPIATVRITRPAESTVGIKVSVQDALTNKEVTRQLDLANLPPDAHPMAIGVGAAELLSASWVELTLAQSPPPARPVPAAVRRRVSAATQRPPGRGSLGVSLAGEEFTGGLRQGGVDARFTLDLLDRWSLTSRLGVRSAQARTTANGRVQADSWAAGLGMVLWLTPTDSRARLGLLGRADLFTVHFTAQPKAGATADSATGTGWTLGGGITGSFLVDTSLTLDAEIDAGGALRGIGATDAGREVLASSGVWVGASAGLGVRF